MGQDRLNKLKMRAHKNTVMQSLLVEGHPSKLFKEKETECIFLKIGEKKLNMGKIGEETTNAIEEMSNAYNKLYFHEINSHKVMKSFVIREMKKFKSQVFLKEFPGIQIRKQGKNTVIVVRAPDEKQLIERVSRLTEYLNSEGVIVQERCNYICVIDKGKMKGISNEKLLEIEKDLKERISKLQGGSDVK